jgi:hypothetical protein
MCHDKNEKSLCIACWRLHTQVLALMNKIASSKRRKCFANLTTMDWFFEHETNLAFSPEIALLLGNLVTEAPKGIPDQEDGMNYVSSRLQ